MSACTLGNWKSVSTKNTSVVVSSPEVAQKIRNNVHNISLVHIEAGFPRASSRIGIQYQVRTSAPSTLIVLFVLFFVFFSCIFLVMFWFFFCLTLLSNDFFLFFRRYCKPTRHKAIGRILIFVRTTGFQLSNYEYGRLPFRSRCFARLRPR